MRRSGAGITNPEFEHCLVLGHEMRFVLPLVKNDERREAWCLCAICGLQTWVRFGPDGYARLCADAKSGELAR